MMPTQKNRTLVVKDYSKLESYGFTKQGTSYYFYTGNKGKWGTPIWTIVIDSRKYGNRPYITSHANITLEVICRMFVDGVIAFEDNNTLESHIAKKEAKIRKLEQELARLKGEE